MQSIDVGYCYTSWHGMLCLSACPFISSAIFSQVTLFFLFFLNWPSLLSYCSLGRSSMTTFWLTTCAERSYTCHHRHTEGWPRLGSDTAWWTSLARHPRLGIFQAGDDRSSMSEHHRTCRITVSRSLVLTFGGICILLAVPCFQIGTYGRQVFSFAGSTVVWNSLPYFNRDPTISADSFRRLLVHSILVHSAR